MVHPTMSSFFAQPGTRVGVLTNAYAEDCEWYEQVCRELGQPFLILTGDVVEKNVEYRTFSSYRIDVGSLPAYLDALCALPVPHVPRPDETRRIS